MALDPITAGIEFARTAVNALWPDKTEQQRSELAAAVVLVQGQLGINQVEAASASPFVAGWRPFVGWACGFACAWNWIALPALVFGFAAAGHAVTLPAADTSQMLPLLLGMLGLGSLRTFEKVKGVA